MYVFYSCNLVIIIDGCKYFSFIWRLIHMANQKTVILRFYLLSTFH